MRPIALRATLIRPCLFLMPVLALGAGSPFNDIFFEPNRGQAPQTVLWIARGPGASLAFTAEGLDIQMGDDARAAVHLRMRDRSPEARFEALDESLDRTSYFVGADPSRWVAGVSHYSRLAWRGVYPGIDVLFYGHGGKLEYDLIVAPGANPAAIRMAFEGAGRLSITRAGDLAIDRSGSSFQMRRPHVFQNLASGDKREVSARYKLARSGIVHFDLGKFDRRRPLILDPTLEFSSYFGGEKDDSVVAVTAQGDVVGVTSSLAFGDGSSRRGKDVFALVSGQGEGRRLYVIGGSNDDVATCALASNNALIVGGWTRSPDLIDQSAFGGSDGFLLAIDRANATAAPQVLRVGGAGEDRIYSLAYGLGIYFAGETTSTDLRGGSLVSQNQALGGKDAFFGVAAGYGASLSPFYLAYFGGSGDDAAYAITTDNRGRIVLAGKTSSTDLPLKDALYAQLSGASDGFLARFEPVSPASIPALEFGTYFGGSGNDEIRALATQVAYGNAASLVFFAGTTTSADLPLNNPAQPRYGGGDSDAFAGGFDLDARKLVFDTYIGGAGRDEAAAIAVSSTGYYAAGLGEPVVIGSTMSSDLPVRNAVQPRLAGSQDAFLAYLDTKGGLQSLSYLGGSGSDRGLAVSFSADNIATLGGETDSLDLPTPSSNPAPGVQSGGLDGFTAAITLTRFAAIGSEAPYWTARDVTTCGSLFVSADVPDRAQLTLTSSDPSLVLVSLTSSAVPSASVSAPISALGRLQGQIEFCLSGVAAGGDTTAAIALDGFAPIQVRARLGTPAIKLSSSPDPGSIYVDDRPIISAAIGVVDDRGSFTVGSVRPGAPAVPVDLSSSNPQVGSLSASRLIVAAPGDTTAANGSVSFTPAGAGQTTISASTSGLAMLDPQSLQLNVLYPKFALGGFEIGKDLVKGIAFQADHQPSESLWNLTITTDNPQQLCFETPLAGCAPSIAVPATNPVFPARALADTGNASVRFSSTVLDQGSATVQFTQPKIFLNAGAARSALLPGASFDLSIGYGSHSDRAPTSQLRSGFNPAVTIASSDPTIVSVVSNSPLQGSLRALAPGQVTISATAPGFEAASPVTLTVAPPPAPSISVSPTSVVIGKDLQATVVLKLSLPGATTPIHLASSDPGLLLVSADGRPGASQADLPPSSNPAFTVQALAGSGSAAVTVSANGYPGVTIPIRLAPAGYAWTNSAVSVSAYSTAPVPFATYVLDPDTLAPMSIQAPRPGSGRDPGISSTNPNAGTITLRADLGNVNFAAASTGKTVLTLAQPAGFTRPSLRGDTQVVVNNASISANVPAFLGKDLQASVNVILRDQNRAPITIRSDDTSRLLVSSDPSSPGSGQIDTVTGTPFYVQALASGGAANIRISGPYLDDAVFPVTLVPAGVAVANAFSRTQPFRLTPLSPDLTLAAALFIDAPVPTVADRLGLRAGAGAVDVGIVSTNPSVVYPQTSVVTFAPGQAGSINFAVRAQDPGEAILRLMPPSFLHTSTGREEVAITVAVP